ncbi:MAG: hypothetical protein QMC70_10765 [Bacteroidia bacterium]|jgi:hypothetical protein|tara:strand:- start:18916 stop:19338 length:423 start_codon:yes stop_codon:yes gene_type:complete
MHAVEVVALIVASGLFVLIWMVQLLVYPGFIYYTKQNLRQWHTAYTPRITLIVAPLMLSQLAIGIYRIYTNAAWFSTAYAILVAAVWLTTFYIFIPIHDKIQKGTFENHLLNKLVSLNWMRTILWSAILILEIWSVIDQI